MKRTILAVLCFFAFLAIACPAVADRDDYRGHGGYRERPYDRHRHYEYHEHGGDRYHYEGHWRSWHDWDDYARHQAWYRHGHYYREEGHLMFRACNPDTGNCFFFSIGR
jgi:hypothetical protein